MNEEKLLLEDHHFRIFFVYVILKFYLKPFLLEKQLVQIKSLKNLLKEQLSKQFEVDLDQNIMLEEVLIQKKKRQ